MVDKEYQHLVVGAGEPIASPESTTSQILEPLKLFITSLVSLNRVLSTILGFLDENYIGIVIFY